MITEALTLNYKDSLRYLEIITKLKLVLRASYSYFINLFLQLRHYKYDFINTTL